LERISNYNIFNNFFPGIIAGIVLGKIFNYNLITGDIVFWIFIYYFIGMILSRIGSVILERPLLFGIKLSSKSRYVQAEKSDSKIQTLQQDANTYRTIVAMSLVVFVALIINQICIYPLDTKYFWASVAVSVLIGILFTASFRKQIRHIISRIK